MLADIGNVVDDISSDAMVFGSDFNNKLFNNTEDSCMIKDFENLYNLTFIDIMEYNASEVHKFSNALKVLSIIFVSRQSW